MEPLKRLYWIRVGLGIAAAMICVVYNFFVGTSEGFNVFLTGFSLAMLIYLLSFYALKPHFIEKVEKPSKVFTTGIGIYFLMWIVFWTLSFTLVIPVHDIAVLSVSPSYIPASELDLFDNITVIVRNEGDFSETFNVTVYYNGTPLQPKTITNMAPKNETTITFTNATEVPPGNYSIKAVVPCVSGEKDEKDNVFPQEE
ncbi:MAG: CARDB domain-containing protein [Thermoproteota archaeon]|nr:CARDB domain-containing protein [Thermoproteota archaeon]